jgi:hypothetical protein
VNGLMLLSQEMVGYLRSGFMKLRMSSAGFSLILYVFMYSSAFFQWNEPVLRPSPYVQEMSLNFTAPRTVKNKLFFVGYIIYGILL